MGGRCGDSRVAGVDTHWRPGIGYSEVRKDSQVAGVRGFSESIGASMKGEALQGEIVRMLPVQMCGSPSTHSKS